MKDLSISRFDPLWSERLFFHPSVTSWVDGKLMMTLQTINGSDYFGPVKWALSEDDGGSWSEPEDIDAFKWRPMDDGTTEGVADVRPFHHERTGKLIAIGCNTYYSSEGHARKTPQHPVYSILSANGEWSERRILRVPALDDSENYRVACAQMVILPDGDVLIPLYFLHEREPMNFAVLTVRCAFDGEVLTVLESGGVLSSPVKRGFIEPSMAWFQGKYFLTIRAEDDRGYLALSDDGLKWSNPVPWHWTDGEELTMSTTQQHWVEVDGELYLLYTRKRPDNSDVMRWRSPLLISRFDTAKLALIRETERIVFPLEYHGDCPNRLGNFHAANLADGNGAVSVASWWPKPEYHTEVWTAVVKPI